MKRVIKKSIIIIGCVLSLPIYAANKVEQLQAEQKNLYATLEQYWFDEKGNFRFGDKNPKTSQFALTTAMMERMSTEQLTKSMKSAIARFSTDQQGIYMKSIEEDFTRLTEVKQELADQRKKLDDAIAVLAKALGKSVENVMKLPDANIKNLVSKLPQDSKIEINKKSALATVAELRPAFGIQTTAGGADFTEERTMGGEGRTTSAREAKTAIAATAAKSLAQVDFNIGSVVKFAGEASKYGTCRDRHYDIVVDTKGVHFISEAR